MKALFLTVILMAFASCGNAQVKTKLILRKHT